MDDWDPDLYRRFEAERTRPAADLLARTMVVEPTLVVDLGCGPGNSTELLAGRFPGVSVMGVDASAAMLDSARRRLPGCEFELDDVSDWSPARAPGLIFANAVLQWVPAHRTTVPRLFSLLRPGGTLAVQMPDNADEPSHRLMHETAARKPWTTMIGAGLSLRSRTVLPADSYYDLLAPQAVELDIWRTTYFHPMPSASAIVTWLRSTGLRPFLDPIPASFREQFLAEYEAEIAKAYPPRSDGQRLFAFPRLFVVARRNRG